MLACTHIAKYFTVTVKNSAYSEKYLVGFYKISALCIENVVLLIYTVYIAMTKMPSRAGFTNRLCKPRASRSKGVSSKLWDA